MEIFSIRRSLADPKIFFDPMGFFRKNTIDASRFASNPNTILSFSRINHKLLAVNGLSELQNDRFRQ